MSLITSNVKTMTLKEITDLIGVRHDKACLKVLSMAEEPEFGTVSITDIVYNDKGQTIQTYVLNQRQSIAVASRLNVALLMRVIDRWQELEAKELQPALPTNYIEALESLVQSEKEKAIAIEQLQEARPKVEYHDRVLATENGLTTTEIAAELGMSAIALNRKLKDAGIQRKIGNRWCLRNDYLSKGYTVERTFIDESETSRHSMAWTEAGRKFIHEIAGAIQ